MLHFSTNETQSLKKKSNRTGDCILLWEFKIERRKSGIYTTESPAGSGGGVLTIQKRGEDYIWNNILMMIQRGSGKLTTPN